MMVSSLMAPNHVTMTVFLVTFTVGRLGLRNLTQALGLTYHSSYALGIRIIHPMLSRLSEWYWELHIWVALDQGFSPCHPLLLFLRHA